MEKEIINLRGLSVKELNNALVEAKKKLETLRLDIASAKNTKVHEVKKTRKTISRILTLLREKEWAEFEKIQGEKDGK